MRFLPLAIMALASMATTSNAIPAHVDGGIHFSPETYALAGPSPSSQTQAADPIHVAGTPSASSLAAGGRASASSKRSSFWDALTGRRRRAVPSSPSKSQRTFSARSADGDAKAKGRAKGKAKSKGKAKAKGRKSKRAGTCKPKDKDNSNNNSNNNSTTTPSNGNGNGQQNNNNSTSGSGSVSTDKVMAGYWPDWTASALPPEKIDFSKFDIINYAFALPTQDQNLNFPVDNSGGLLKRLVSAAHAADSKVVLAIGGWGGSTYFSPSVRTADARSRFIANIKKVYDQYKLDGIDLDWEYPGQSTQGSQSDPSDTANFQTFLTELRQALPQGAIISAAVAHNPWRGSNGQPVPSVARAASALDYILIMNYDVWGSSSNPGPNAPLADLCGNSTQPQANAAAGVKQWAAAGMPRNKILMGIPSYGYINTSGKTKLRQRSLKDEMLAIRDATPHAPRTAPQSDVPSGKVGRYDARYLSKRATLTADDGSTGSGQINFKTLIKQGALKKGSSGLFEAGNGFTKYWDNCSNTPFLTNGQLVVTYDDTSSIWDKGSFAKQAGIAGLSMWSIDGDTQNSDLVNAAIAGMAST